MRLTRILMFPCFLSALQMGCPLNRDAIQNASADKHCFLRDQLLFVRIAVIVLQTGACPQDHIRNGVTDQDYNLPQ